MALPILGVDFWFRTLLGSVNHIPDDSSCDASYPPGDLGIGMSRRMHLHDLLVSTLDTLFSALCIRVSSRRWIRYRLYRLV